MARVFRAAVAVWTECLPLAAMSRARSSRGRDFFPKSPANGSTLRSASAHVIVTSFSQAPPEARQGYLILRCSESSGPKAHAIPAQPNGLGVRFSMISRAKGPLHRRESLKEPSTGMDRAFSPSEGRLIRILGRWPRLVSNAPLALGPPDVPK